MRLAIYPGTFDLVTNGHLDLIQRASRLFDEIIIAVTDNPSKNPLFTVEERKEMISAVIHHLPNVKVDSFSGLLVEYAMSKGAHALVRGLRAISDFEYEFQMALVNRKISKGISTVFLMSDEKYTYLNSTIVKEVSGLGGDVSSFVPPIVLERIGKKLKKQ